MCISFMQASKKFVSYGIAFIGLPIIKHFLAQYHKEKISKRKVATLLGGRAVFIIELNIYYDIEK